MWFNIVLIFFNIWGVAFGSELFGPKSGVRELSTHNFKNQVLYNGNVTAVLFYAPWCGYCQGLAPDWKQVAKSLRGIARVTAVDCNEDKNKQLCAKYDIKGFPTIKVFQPAKLSDVDFKDAVEGKPLKRRRPTMYSYNGARDAKAITSYVVDKLRNYAASLDSDEALRWLAPNKVPRVVMLPGKKYKSKTISPLFKVLSREYFGQLRFAYVPRRVDGAWNLLGIPAPDESQLVYLSDDKPPVVYKGSMKKRDLKRFLDEQYELEMYRRLHTGQQEIDRDNAAWGLEYVTEDAQEEEIEHVRERREKEEVLLQAAEEARKAAFERHGKSAPERKSSATSATVSSTSSTSSAVEGDATQVDEKTFVDVEDFDSEIGSEPEFESDANVEPETEAEFENANEDAVLDEAVIELTPDQIVQEGPEAIASYMAAHAPTRTGESNGSTKSGASPAPKATASNEAGMESYDDFVQRCIRPGLNCVVLATTEDQLKSDIIVLIRTMEHLNRNLKQSTVFDYLLTDKYPELDEFLDVIGLHNRPGLLFWDARKQRIQLYNEGWSQRELRSFLEAGYHRKLNMEQELPPKYLYWLTEAEVKAEAEAEAEKNTVKDEL